MYASRFVAVDSFKIFFILLLFSLIHVLSKAEQKGWMETVNQTESTNNHQGEIKTFLASVLGDLLLVLLYLVALFFCMVSRSIV